MENTTEAQPTIRLRQIKDDRPPVTLGSQTRKHSTWDVLVDGESIGQICNLHHKVEVIANDNGIRYRVGYRGIRTAWQVRLNGVKGWKGLHCTRPGAAEALAAEAAQQVLALA